MIAGIVGNEAAKFTKLGRKRAIELITSIISDPEVTEVVSGGCHLGGIDRWTRQVADRLGKPCTEFIPEQLNWPDGFRPRNLKIARKSDIVHCIAVDRLPEDYRGMRFKLCYHCGTNDHVKSGGCWTMKKAKKSKLHIIEN